MDPRRLSMNTRLLIMVLYQHVVQPRTTRYLEAK